MAGEITEAALIAALTAADPSAYIEEMEAGTWVIDGEFNMSAVVAALAKGRPEALPEASRSFPA